MGLILARKGWKDELETKEVGLLAKNVLKKAFLDVNNEIPLEKKAQIAGQVYSRLLPKDINIGMDDSLKIVIENLIPKKPVLDVTEKDKSVEGSQDKNLLPYSKAG